MRYNPLGRCGLKISELGLGSWITFAKQVDKSLGKQLIHHAFSKGVNFFDTAESYAHGEAEIIMGEALKDFPRHELVVSTKIYWGGKGPNDTSLSRKHLIEGTKNSLRRLQMDYVDLLFCHRPDPSTPIEETILALDYLVRGGYVLYWGTSEWNAKQIDTAFKTAKQLNCIPPTVEQPEYNMLHRETIEKELVPLYQEYGIGTTIWSPLASGVLTGKYNDGIPADSRLANETWLRKSDLPTIIEKVKKLQKIAKNLDCSMAQLAIAWCLKNVNVSSVILGASRLEQLEENLDSLKVTGEISADIYQEIQNILRS